MSTRAKQSNLLDLADSDSDDGFAVYKPKDPTSDSMPPPKKRGSRVAANRVTKPSKNTSTRRANTKLAGAVEKAGGLKVLSEKSENQQAGHLRGRKPAAKKTDPESSSALATPPQSDEPKKKRGGRGRPKAASKELAKEVPDSVQPKAAAMVAKKPGQGPGGPGQAAEKQPEESSEIPETQLPYAMDIDAEEQDQIEDLPTYAHRVPFSAQQVLYRAPFDAVDATKRPTSSSDMDSDLSVRRRLGEMTKKYESLQLKYRDLRDVAVREAERNFDRLKKQGEERAEAAKQLVGSLKKDLAAQQELAKDGQRYQRQLEASEARVDTLQAQITEMASSLSEAKAEVKTLNTKLSAARAAEAIAAARVPGSAMKGNSLGSRNEGVQAAQTAKIKEELYRDLTGLIVTSVKRDGPEDVYDCIQTGRNGSLHFKLAVANENSKEPYEDAQFMYMPQLDEERDNELIELLPDYLVEEITFPRLHAAKFYSRVMKSLNERVE